MHITEHTDTKLVLELDGNQLLGLSLQIAGALIFISMILFGVDFRANSEYTAMSAQNLNLAIKVFSCILAAIALGLVFSVLKQRDQAYVFDKTTSTMTIISKGLNGRFQKQYPLSSIKEILLSKTFSPPDPQGYSTIPTPDNFFIILALENTSKGIILQYRSLDRQFTEGIIGTIQKFLAIASQPN